MDAAIRAPQADTVQGPNDLAVLASSAVLVSATPEHRRSPCLCPSFSSSHSLASVSPSNFSLMPREPPPASLDFAALASDPSIFSVPRLSASCRPRCHWTAPLQLQVPMIPVAGDTTELKEELDEERVRCDVPFQLISRGAQLGRSGI
ncbi:uncharacterized protein LOC125548313 isoform X1 [Triticum urartu]|uniref:uncharacterized protein LOC125548313 isoform X1 n=1 Tax=Triticum urartu TaxID=4572 RepID=UPI002044336A|nr:uncharacterized protein LOC125548313 isoform X1 [Triticum urartu]